ncbi:MAG TPA: (2Fe-2S) ferredoxin domain-containing protein [Anaerolineales bacterium]|nr:(2Fe-2S) ferredoxin domain-containing protein [Anaerolineales bacterium]
MPSIKSLEELKKIREAALQKRDIKTAEGRVQIVVGMGTPGIAAGARDTVKEFLSIIEEKNMADIVVRQTGNFGLDSMEPVVQVIIDGAPAVTYGKVTPYVARQIMEQHVIGGKIVEANLIPTEAK